MENIVEEVEDKSQNEGSPANSQRYEDMGRCEGVSSSDSVDHNDVLSRYSHGHHWVKSQADLKNEYDGVVTELLDKCRLMRSFLSLRIHHVLQINLIKAEKYLFQTFWLSIS